MCDGVLDCTDGSDESNCNFMEKLSRQHSYMYNDGCSFVKTANKLQPCLDIFTHHLDVTYTRYTQYDNKNSVNLTTLRCDEGYALCHHEGLECFLQHKRCAFERDIHGEPVHCKNTEHLEFCEHYQCPSMYKCQASYCIALHMVCDGISDCPHGEDESYCAILNAAGMLWCPKDRIYVPMFHVCDNTTHCTISSDDETLCLPFICPLGCHCLGYSVICLQSEVQVTSLSSTVVAFYYQFMPSVPILDFTDYYALVILDLMSTPFSSRMIPHMFLENATSLKYLNLYNTSIAYIGNKPFMKSKNIKHINILGNHIISIDINSFAGLNNIATLDMHNISLKTISQDSFVQQSSLDVLNISVNKIRTLKSGTFNGLNHLKILDMRFNDIMSVEMGMFDFVYITNVLTSVPEVFCFIPNNVLQTFKNIKCELILSSTYVMLLYWFAVIYVVVCSFLNVMFQIATEKFNPRSLLVIDISVNDLSIALNCVIVLLTHMHFGYTYPFFTSEIADYAICSIYSSITITVHIVHYNSLIMLAAIYHRVTVYAMVKTAFSTRDITAAIIINRIIVMLVASMWTLYITKFTQFFCLPFQLQRGVFRTWYFNLLLCVLVVFVNLVGVVVVLLMYFKIRTFVVKSSNRSRGSGGGGHARAVTKSFIVNSVLHILELLLNTLLVILPLIVNNSSIWYGYLVALHAVCNSTANVCIYSRNHLSNTLYYVKYTAIRLMVHGQMQCSREKVSRLAGFLAALSVVICTIYISMS